MSRVVLFDLPSKGRASCWSLNPWKTRLILNYKNIDYETQWLEYPDVASTLKSHGIPQNTTKGTTPYTIPAIKLSPPNQETLYKMDSAPISELLESYYPTPSLHLDSENLPRVIEILGEIVGPSRGLWMPFVPSALLNEVSAEYFTRTREEAYGMSLVDFAAEEGGEKAWGIIAGPLRDLGRLLEERNGPFVEGLDASYADFHIVGLLHFWKRIDEALLARAVEIEPRLGRLYDASSKWLERDDH